ncbi:hypothetical protein DCAR_0205268 [Daucus carota subsp. sativus]|uniref:Uncharacterized protein n=1 Tax=Daucus carota subsp. sativus TaxID=79200 RepID=A0A175YBZ1_DAUCS|nr:hypothetical protein DCAR_0205268 [Daucus carota subsp. sativus]
MAEAIDEDAPEPRCEAWYRNVLNSRKAEFGVVSELYLLLPLVCEDCLHAPFPVTATGHMEDMIATVPVFLCEELRLSYVELYARYHEVFVTRDALLRMIATSRPAAPISDDGLVRRSEVIDVMHQTATSVITGLQSA